jgi:hypothetical protein
LLDITITGIVERVQSHCALQDVTLYISQPEPNDPSELPKWFGWFKNYDWEPFQEGDELSLALADGRRGTAVVRRITMTSELSAPIIDFDSKSTLQ